MSIENSQNNLEQPPKSHPQKDIFPIEVEGVVIEGFTKKAQLTTIEKKALITTVQNSLQAADIHWGIPNTAQEHLSNLFQQLPADIQRKDIQSIIPSYFQDPIHQLDEPGLLVDYVMEAANQRTEQALEQQDEQLIQTIHTVDVQLQSPHPLKESLTNLEKEGDVLIAYVQEYLAKFKQQVRLP